MPDPAWRSEEGGLGRWVGERMGPFPPVQQRASCAARLRLISLQLLFDSRFSKKVLLVARLWNQLSRPSKHIWVRLSM